MTQYYYVYDEASKTIKTKECERQPKQKGYPSDAIIGLEFFSPEKSFAEMSAQNYTDSLVQDIKDLATAPVDSLYMEKCKECGKFFVINTKEYEWYASRDLIPPKRCKKCRTNRKKIRESEEAAAAKDKKGNKENK